MRELIVRVRHGGRNGRVALECRLGGGEDRPSRWGHGRSIEEASSDLVARIEPTAGCCCEPIVQELEPGLARILLGGV